MPRLSLDLLQSLLDNLQQQPLLHPQLLVSTEKNSMSSEDVPISHGLTYCPEWTNDHALKQSHVMTIRERDGAGRFRMSFELKDYPNLFWTSLRLSHDRNVPARWRMYIRFSDEFEYEVMPWVYIENATWTLLPSVLPAFYTIPGKIYIEVDIPDEPYPGKNINMVLRLCGFQKLLPWAPSWNLCDEYGNRLLTWVPAKDCNRTNDARIYHCLYDPEPPFEPNVRNLPRAVPLV